MRSPGFLTADCMSSAAMTASGARTTASTTMWPGQPRKTISATGATRGSFSEKNRPRGTRTGSPITRRTWSAGRMGAIICIIRLPIPPSLLLPCAIPRLENIRIWATCVSRTAGSTAPGRRTGSYLIRRSWWTKMAASISMWGAVSPPTAGSDIKSWGFS